MSTPTTEQIEEVLLSCRYGELDEVKDFVSAHGWQPLAEARDERGNTALHMCSGNGHVDVLSFLTPNVPATLLQHCNESGSPPLHWAILNNHVSVVKHLVELPEEQGGGVALLNQKNASGRDAFSEALWAGEGKEEVAGWIEGYLFKLEGEGEGGVEGEGEEISASAGITSEQEGDDVVQVQEVSNGDEEVKEEAVKELQEKVERVEIGR